MIHGAPLLLRGRLLAVLPACCYLKVSMNKLLPALLLCLLGFAVVLPAAGQDTDAGIDLLYPQLAYPEKDVRAAIKKDDLRFVVVDRFGKDAPRVNQYPRLKHFYGTKLPKQPFRIFASKSQDFSFMIRARAYAEVYNRILLQHLLRHRTSEIKRLLSRSSP